MSESEGVNAAGLELVTGGVISRSQITIHNSSAAGSCWTLAKLQPALISHCRITDYLHTARGIYTNAYRYLGRLQIFGTMHKKMQISLKWLKYRLKILKSSFIYYFYIVPVVPKLKKLKKSPYDQNNRNWMSH